MNFAENIAPRAPMIDVGAQACTCVVESNGEKLSLTGLCWAFSCNVVPALILRVLDFLFVPALCCVSSCTEINSEVL